MRIQFESDELYPVYNPITESHYTWTEGERTFEVSNGTYARWITAFADFNQAQAEMLNLMSPPCPECGHRQIRHQEWSKGWDNWACLDCRTCRHGCPPERLAALENPPPTSSPTPKGGAQ